MTVEQMIDGFKTIELLEKDLMRDLTEKEKKVVLLEGWEKLLFAPEYLNFSKEDYKELKGLKRIISAFYTQDEEEFKKAVKECPDEVYFVLQDIIKAFEDYELAENPTCSSDSSELKYKKDPVQEFVQFMQDLHNSLPKDDAAWFNKLTEEDHKKLFEEVYSKERNDQQDCDDNSLGGIITDAVKDLVIERFVARLKNKEVVEMTNDDYLEVADYLCEHEKHIFLSNENGKVRLVLF